jgi:hypothetical protein
MHACKDRCRDFEIAPAARLIQPGHPINRERRREGGQGQFFYAFDLDEVVPCDHLVRQIDAVLDLN